MNIDIIAGARPNFMKIAPIILALKKEKKNGVIISIRLIHTGQHYDKNMSEDFFHQLELPEPNYNLNCGGGTQANQAGKIMVKYEELIKTSSAKTDLCIVVGDVTSTMACSIVAKQNGIKVAHVEAGLRSFDMSMPEEINRIVTDSLTDLFFTTSIDAGENLVKEGIPVDKIFFVGNTMIDTLIKNKKNFKKPSFWDECRLEHNNYMLLTIHRPANVDNEDILNSLIETILNNCRDKNVIFPIHPRTIKKFNLRRSFPKLITFPPIGYFEFMYLLKNSFAVITDSGGITEEATYLNIPCITLRENTERPETIKLGTNVLVGNNKNKIKRYMSKLFNTDWKNSEIPQFWDGKAGSRIVKSLLSQQF